MNQSNSWDIFFHLYEEFVVHRHKHAIVEIDNIPSASLHLHIHPLHIETNVISRSLQRLGITTLKSCQQLHKTDFNFEKLRHCINYTNYNAIHISVLHQKRLLLDYIFQ